MLHSSLFIHNLGLPHLFKPISTLTIKNRIEPLFFLTLSTKQLTMNPKSSSDTSHKMTPEAYQEFMNSILSRFTDEQLDILTTATEKALKQQEEFERKITRKFENATWRQIDLLERIKTKSIIYRAERRILSHYIKTYFINPLNDMKPDLGNEQANIKNLGARIQFYQDIINLLNQKYTSLKH